MSQRSSALAFLFAKRTWIPDRPIVQVALVAVVAFAVYALATGNGFAYDDVVVVRGDARVTEFQLRAIITRPYWASPGFALYRPLVTLSFAADWAISNGNAAWFHAVNGLWHALASAALFTLLLAWFAAGPALFGALLFAVHPVHVEAVANIVGRAELMAGTFFLLACAIWAHQVPRKRGSRVALVSAFYLLAMLCKESAATLPAILLLIDAVKSRWRVRQLPRELRARWWDYGVLAAILAGVILLRTALAGSPIPTELDPVMEVARPAADRVRSALQVWPHIARLLVFPNQLLADYGPRVLMPADGWTGSAVLGLVIVAALTLGGLLLFERGRPLVALAALWLPITLLPVANLLFPIGVLLAERTLYVPSIAVSLGAALLLARTHVLAIHRQRIGAAAALVLILFTARVQTRIPDWDSTDSIMMAQRRDRPDSFRAEWHAARMARREGHDAIARQRYQRALHLWPYRRRLVVEAAAYLGHQRDVAGALRVARFGVQRWPDNLELQRLLATHALDSGDTATARVALAAALRIAPNDSLLLQMSNALTPQKAIR